MSKPPILPPGLGLPKTADLLPESSDYELMTLATIASHLLQGHNYANAVARALALLDECKATLKQRALSAVSKTSEATRPAEETPRDMSWDEFLFYATGESRLDRAEMKLLDAVKLRIQTWHAHRALGNHVGLPHQPTLADWKAHLSFAPATTTEEAWDHMAMLRQSELVSGSEARTYKWLFSRFYSVSKALSASSGGSTPTKQGKKRGRPKKN